MDLLEFSRRFLTCAFCNTSLALSDLPLLAFLGSETNLLRRRFSSIHVSVTTGGQRLSSDFVAQWAATFGVMRSHTDALATETGSRKGAVRECTASSMLKKDVTLLEPFVQCWVVGQSGRVPSTPIYRNPFLPEPSSNILPETSRNLENLPDDSRLFQILLDSSLTQRSSPNGLIGTCVGNDSPYAAVLTRRLIGTCAGLV